MSQPPIVCISANPALDRRLRIGTLALGEVNRVRSLQAVAGGKAAHVAIAGRALGATAVWVGFLGGGTGEQCASELRGVGIEVFPIRVRAATRVNFELIEDSKRITEVLEPGGPPDEGDREKMLRVCATSLAQEWKGAVVVISGSLPPGIPSDFYTSLIKSAREGGSKVLLDTSGEALRASLGARPHLVKLNRKEAETLLGHPVENLKSAVDATRELIRRGPHSAAVTLGAEGMVWIESPEAPAWIVRPPRVIAISAVGCGDATLAGFAHAFLQGITGEQAIRLAAACGTANCMAELPGRISAQNVEALIPKVDVKLLE